MAELPFIPLYVPDFDSATSFLTLEEEGLYFRLLRLMWQTPGCSVPDDDRWLTRRLRTADRELIRSVVDDFCEVSDGRIYQKRLQEEFSKAKKVHRARKKAGSKGGKTNALKINDLKGSKASNLLLAKDKQSSSSAVASTTTTTTTTTTAKAVKRASQISSDWMPDDELVSSIAGKHSCSAKLVKDEAYTFRNYWLGEGKAKKDWQATFRNWCAKDYCAIHEKNKSTLSENKSDFDGQGGIQHGW
jgi:uncharacterized protein YdaU (DUF1376 family)